MNLARLGSRLAALRKGENYEIRQDLNSQYRDIRKEGIKRVIASMTLGKDVSSLFPDVLKNMQTDDLEQKKLVYLYLVNYAKTQPELVILAVNTFVRDTEDGNPLIRALAMRTMGCLRADKILDYIADPLSRCLRDESPYVRKTAALGVIKVFTLKRELAEEHGFVDALYELVADSNPMVVSNAVIALSEIHEATGSAYVPDAAAMQKLTIALGETSEWGRIALLNALGRYTPTDAKEAEHICERVVPQFQHANASVVLAAIKVVFAQARYIADAGLVRTMTHKMAPPLVTLISSAPEIQWVALRNVNLVLQAHPDMLADELRVFFCKYNDPLFVKIEKLEIMTKLANEHNVDSFLLELREYASEVDVDFVRRAVKAIGSVAVKIDAAADKCVQVLLDLIATRVGYVVQEAVSVVKDVFRRYPNRYEKIIPLLCAAIDNLEEPEAKASLVWILGEYAGHIEDAHTILATFVDTFNEDAPAVQLALLEAIIKLFLKKPNETPQALVQRVLQLATESVDSPDIRDRAYVAWRLLSADPDLASRVLLSQKPPIELPSSTLAPALLDELIAQLGSVSSVYHKPARLFVAHRPAAPVVTGTAAVPAAASGDATSSDAIATIVAGSRAENLLDLDDGDDVPAAPAASAAVPVQQQPAQKPATLDDLLGIFDGIDAKPQAQPQPQPQPTHSAATAFDDLLS